MAKWLGHQTSDLAVMGLISRSGRYQAPTPTQPSIPLGLVNRVPALLSGFKAGCARLCWAASKIV